MIVEVYQKVRNRCITRCQER